MVFAKFKNSLVGHKGKIILNRRSKENDYEAEMAIVIGKRGAYIPKEEAMDHVFGYTLATTCLPVTCNTFPITSGVWAKPATPTALWVLSGDQGRAGWQ